MVIAGHRKARTEIVSQGFCHPHPRSGNAGPVSSVPQELAGIRAASWQVWGIVGCAGLQPKARCV